MSEDLTQKLPRSDSEMLNLILTTTQNLEGRFDHLEERFGKLEVRIDKLDIDLNRSIHDSASLNLELNKLSHAC